mmetsp:Transcript_8113/g.13916  ORF Transcript_8113/g.13916 Transcript_8113/m.13916 type:complete len:133 (-) Transcript_8113:176-574(-)
MLDRGDCWLMLRRRSGISSSEEEKEEDRMSRIEEECGDDITSKPRKLLRDVRLRRRGGGKLMALLASHPSSSTSERANSQIRERVPADRAESWNMSSLEAVEAPRDGECRLRWLRCLPAAARAKDIDRDISV